MNGKAKQKFLNSAATQCVSREYDSQRILHIIRLYYELRSSAEITTAHYGRIGGESGRARGKDDILCVLADIDQGVTVLSSRQTEVLSLLKMGYLVKEISKILGLRKVTVNFHIRQAGVRLANYLNASGTGRRWTR